MKNLKKMSAWVLLVASTALVPASALADGGRGELRNDEGLLRNIVGNVNSGSGSVNSGPGNAEDRFLFLDHQMFFPSFLLREDGRLRVRGDREDREDRVRLDLDLDLDNLDLEDARHVLSVVHPIVSPVIIPEPEIDVAPPVMSNVAVHSTTPGTATVTWKTDKPASSTVFIGTAAPLDLTSPATASVTSTALTKDHSIFVTGLTRGTTFVFVALSIDASGNKVTSSTMSFMVP